MHRNEALYMYLVGAVVRAHACMVHGSEPERAALTNLDGLVLRSLRLRCGVLVTLHVVAR